MFKGGATNPYDDIVVKTTDENLTSENWELILNLCDKVQDDGEQGARNVVAAVLKRLAHRNPNVQLYALSLVEALSKNCGIIVHREIASKSFTQGLEKIITDRNTHDKVKRKALSLIGLWTAEFKDDHTLGVMEDCYNSLKSKNYKFEEPSEPPPPQVDDEIRRKEEEELQRVLEMSMQDKGGRAHWEAYAGLSSTGAGASSSSASLGQSSSAGPSRTAGSPGGGSTVRKQSYGYPAPTVSGYVPARSPSPTPVHVAAAPAQVPVPVSSVVSFPTAAASPVQPLRSPEPGLAPAQASRVRALHTFEATEAGELSFEKGDIIKVVDRNYKDWWRGQLKGRTGIFPVNYVEPIPDPTPSEIAREAEQEAAVFEQAANIDRLLTMLRGLDPAKDNLADNEEIQELYRSSMAVRPRIVKLIEKYSQKRAELVLMKDTFAKAHVIFERLMDDSLARHTAIYDTRASYQPPVQHLPRVDTRTSQDYRVPTVTPYVYDQPPAGNYSGFPQPRQTYGPEVYSPAVAATPAQQHPAQAAPQPYEVPYGQSPYQQQPVVGQPDAAYGPVGPQPQPQPQPQQPQPGMYQQPQMQPRVQQAQPQPQAQVPGTVQPQQPQAQIPGQAQSQPQVGAYGEYAQPQPQPQPQQQPQPQPHAQPSPEQQYPAQPQPGPYGEYDYGQQHQQPNPQGHGQAQPTQPQPAVQDPGQVQQAQPIEQTQQPQAQPQPQAQASPQAQATPRHITEGPPYVYDPQATYADPNVQAWVQYYAQGGKDLTGSSYFISVPGLTDGTAPQSPSAQQAAQGQQQAQAQGAAAGATDASAYHQGYAAQQGQPGAANDIPGYSAHAAQAGAYANETPGYSAHAVQAANAYAYGQQPSSPTGSLSRGQSFTAQGAHPHDPQAQYNAQYAQMHGQFAGMGVSERSPTGVTSPQPA